MIYGPFAPRYGAGQTVATSTSSGTTTIGLGNKCLCFQNLDSTNTIHFRVSQGSSTATTAMIATRPRCGGRSGRARMRPTGSGRATSISPVMGSPTGPVTPRRGASRRPTAG